VIRRTEAMVIIVIFDDRVSLRPLVCVDLDFCITIVSIKVIIIFLFLDLFTSFEVSDEAYRNKIIIPVENVITRTKGVHLSGIDL